MISKYKDEITIQYQTLLKVLNRYSYEYHTLDNPTVDDSVYDSLMVELKKIEQEYPDLISPNSPSQRVGNIVKGGFEKIQHSTRMLSLNDVFSYQEVRDWFLRIKKINPELKEDFFADIKMDGLACSLIFDDGEFVRAVTRGDSFIGEDVSSNVRTIKNIPLSLPIVDGCENFLSGRTEVRGEIVIFKSDFEKINQERKLQGMPEFANPRNLAAGTIRQLDPKITATRPLKFIAYDILRDNESDVLTNEYAYKIIDKLGFSINPQAQSFNSLDEVIHFIDYWSERRKDLDFNTDGLVVKINDRLDFQRLGIVGKQPRAAVAFKYSPEEVTARIRDIVISIGRTGVATPVAVFDAVQLAGTTVTHASLHNADEISRLDVRVGDTVVVYKAGDIIPKILRTILDLRPKDAKAFDFEKELDRQYPDVKFYRPEGEVAYRIIGTNSDVILKKSVEFYASKSGLDIENLGEKNVNLLVDKGLITDISDIYKLKKTDLIGLERFAELSAENLINAIDDSKKPELNKFISALGIRYVGDETAKLLAKKFLNFKNLQDASLDQLLEINGIGIKVAESIISYFSNDDNLLVLQKMFNLGVDVQPFILKNGSLEDMRVVVTGTLENYSREQIADKIEELGGSFQKAITKETDILIIGHKVGKNKIAKANQMGVKVISEDKFIAQYL